jgi:hypothetical protein
MDVRKLRKACLYIPDPDRYSNSEPPEFESIMLLLHQSVRYNRITLSNYPSTYLIHPPIHRPIYPSIFHFSSVTQVTGFQSLFVTFTCLMRLRVLQFSASSLFHSAFSPHFGFPSTFIFLSAMRSIFDGAVCITHAKYVCISF